MGGNKYASQRCPVGEGLFIVMDAWRCEALKTGLDVIRINIGSSDFEPDSAPLQTLKAAIDDPTTYRYTLKSMAMELPQAACDWFKRRYGVTMDPATQALTLIGSQEGLAHLLLGVTDPGDSILMPDVGYACYWGAIKVAGLEAAFLPLDDELLPRFEAVPEQVAIRAKVMLLNYPSNPTAATATVEFFERAIDFCKRHDILLIHDAPYIGQVYEGTAPSPLALPGGLDCCVELYSFSKSHHIPGFRLGFALGNADAIEALEAVKGPIDFNQYKGIQLMGVTCLSMPDDRVKADAQELKRRAASLVAALAAEGWHVRMPKSGMYLWAKLPPSFQDDWEFCKDLTLTTGVMLAPGRGFGPGGYGHVRISLVFKAERLQEAAKRIGEWARSRGINLSESADTGTPKSAHALCS